MKKLNKNIFAFCFVFIFAAAGMFAQQITKFGVVDTSKVYSAYFRNSAPIRNYEKKKAEFQEEIDKRTQELKTLQQKKLEYEKNGNESQALKVEA